MMSLMPCTACRSMSSASLNASKKLVPRGTSASSRSLGMAITVSTVHASSRQALVGLPHAPRAFEPERLGDHRHRERVQFLGQRRHHRRRARARAAAQAGGDEHHVGALQQLDDAVGIFERRLPADPGIRSGAQAIGDLRADLQLVAQRSKPRAPARRCSWRRTPRLPGPREPCAPPRYNRRRPRP